MTEKEIIRGIIARDREALNNLVHTYQEKVIKTAYYYLGSMEDAEDLAQDIFLEIVSSIKKFRQSSSLSTWIYRITVNRSLNAVKKRKRKRELIRPENIMGDVAAGVDDDPAGSEERRKLLRASVSALPVNQRTAFILCKYEELSYKEIAEVMGTSLSSVESLIHRAKMNLRKSLAGYFEEYVKKRS